MLTNIDWIKEGEPFPPDCEKERIRTYSDNRRLFQSKQAEVYEKQLKRIERVIGNFDEVISYTVVTNFQKLITLKTADLLLGEPPKISCEESPETIKSIEETSDLLNILYQAAIDISRYGDALLLVRKSGDAGIIDVTQPQIWYPIVSADDVHEFKHHVLAWRNGDKLKVRIHSIGSYEEREYAFDDSLANEHTIGKLISSGKIVQTGLDDFAVVQISNTLTSDTCTGMDDYTDIDSIVSDFMVRIGQIDRILDRHANPSMSGPQTVLEKDERTGEWRMKVGNYYPREADDVRVEYITWDGELESSFKMLEKLQNLLYTTSEMGSAIFGDLLASGQISSAKQLKLTMNAPLAKVNRIRMRFDPRTKKAIKLCSQLGGKNIKNLKDSTIDIIWHDGLPQDELEQADIMFKRTGGKATISQLTAIKRQDDVDDESAEKELAMIMDDEAAVTPLATPPFSDTEEI